MINSHHSGEDEQIRQHVVGKADRQRNCGDSFVVKQRPEGMTGGARSSDFTSGAVSDE